jgi:hypothetical protein
VIRARCSVGFADTTTVDSVVGCMANIDFVLSELSEVLYIKGGAMVEVVAARAVVRIEMIGAMFTLQSCCRSVDD